MLPLRDCRGYRSRYINALNRAVRSLTPIAGRGIRLRQSAQGVVIEAAAKGGGGGGTPFRHRWQVKATREVEPDGSASWTVNIRPGSVWTAAEDGAVADAALTPVAPVAPDAENGGWKVEGATSGSLYVALDAAGALLLKYGYPAAETAAVILCIADVAFTTGDPPSAVITQRQVGDERIGSAEEPIDNPAAWEVRAFEEEQDDGTKRKVWKVWSPTFTAGNQTIYAKTNNFEQTTNGWNRLLVPGSMNGLYAVLTMEGTVSGPYDGPGVVTWRVSNARIYFGSASNYYAYGKPPTREEPGIKEVAVLIGVFIDQEGASWSKFTQLHTGSIVVALRKDADGLQDYDFRDEEPLHEDVPLPTAFAITEDGKLEISTRNAKIPIAQTDNKDKILLDLPSGGGSGNVDTLGPIEWDASRSAYVQYIGKWTWSGSAWVFARKKQASGADYPPAKVYPVTAADLLIRGRGGSSGTALTDDIKTLRFYLPFASASATSWLTKRETEVSNGVTYEPPESVDGNGQLKTGTFTLTYWSDTSPSTPQETGLLYTVVETANATSTYEG